ncbi:hypothetical protein [Leucobacter aridicollis]|uniref:hypothetical protein n=1 Tax=Leucobacter aridicollis TaxID=283878 RepID=UPI0021024F76|nr:hypothetical protein [Leucobacter aridicollis]UTX53372.1 hypothetical protein KI794_00995 [Leucobacter aridicollis]
MEVGEVWAYRERGRLPLTPVEILALSQKPRPSRVKVGFTADEFEGATAWVPLGRLKTLWGAHEPFLEDERKIDALYEAGRPSEHEIFLSDDIFDELGKGNFAFRLPDRFGVLEITDVTVAARLTGMSSEELLSDPLTYSTAGTVLVPWQTAWAIVSSLIERNPRKVADILSRYRARLAKEQQEARAEQAISRWTIGADEIRDRLAAIRERFTVRHEYDLLLEVIGESENALLQDHVELRAAAAEHEALLLEVLQVFKARKSEEAAHLRSRIRASLGLPCEESGSKQSEG